MLSDSKLDKGFAWLGLTHKTINYEKYNVY